MSSENNETKEAIVIGLKLGFLLLIPLFMVMAYISANKNSAPVAPVTENTPLTLAQIAQQRIDKEDAISRYVVNRFNLTAKVKSDNQVLLKLDSDAPDGLTLGISAYRTYDGVDDTTKKKGQYMAYYFDDKISIEELKKGRMYNLDHRLWKETFETEQVRDSVTGFKRLPKSISSNVVFSVFTQPNPDILGKDNEKLTGIAAKEHWGRKILDSKKILTIPLSVKPRTIASLNPENLKIGHRYRTLQDDIPLIPQYNPSDKMAALRDVKKLPSGTPFTIQKKVIFEGDSWYRVSADFDIIKLSGWINSRAISTPEAITDR